MKYSVTEIDRMRAAVSRMVFETVAEDALRTYMLNGTTPEELEVAARELDEKRLAEVRAENERRWAGQSACSHTMTSKGRGNFSECTKCGFTVIYGAATQELSI